MSEILPTLASQRQLEFEEIRPYLLDPREDYPEPYYMLEYNGVPFSTIGGIQAISGQKKNGKSFVLTQLMAAILGTGCERVEKNLPGLKVPARTLEYLGHEPTVLYVDTEMEKLNSTLVLRRVHWLCGWDMKTPNSRLNVEWLREVDANDSEPAFKKRYRLIKYAIDCLEPDIVFIDGVRDIIGDFNDNKESAELVQELMSLASQKNICIWLALHMNPKPGNDDESKMRGHLGTELGNKVSDTLVSSKKKEGGRVSFKVRQVDARGKDMDDWTFEITDDAGNLGIPRILNFVTEEKQEYDNPEDIRRWIDIARDTYDSWPMSRKDIKAKVFKAIGGQKNTSMLQADLNVALNLNMLEESTIKANGYPMLQPPDLPF